jgi:hypothetical protein
MRRGSERILSINENIEDTFPLKNRKLGTVPYTFDTPPGTLALVDWGTSPPSAHLAIRPEPGRSAAWSIAGSGSGPHSFRLLLWNQTVAFWFTFQPRRAPRLAWLLSSRMPFPPASGAYEGCRSLPRAAPFRYCPPASHRAHQTPSSAGCCAITAAVRIHTMFTLDCAFAGCLRFRAGQPARSGDWGCG